MKKLLQGAVLPFTIFSFGLVLLGCNQAAQTDADRATAQDQVEIQAPHNDNERTHTSHADLKSGNMLYIAADVANFQLKAGDYLEKLQQTQTDLQEAINSKDQQQLQTTTRDLSRQLQAFNTALISLDLKSQEIDGIRQHVLQANKQILNSSFLNGEVDFSKLDFKKIQSQMSTIETEMMKLAGMMIPSTGSKSDQS